MLMEKILWYLNPVVSSIGGAFCILSIDNYIVPKIKEKKHKNILRKAAVIGGFFGTFLVYSILLMLLF
jgi:hypothetical protein